MRITVFGATGGTGRRLIEQALAQGHEVTAVVREPARLPVEHDRLRVLQADVFDPASIEAALTGADAVLSALGPDKRRKEWTVCSRATRSIVQAMATTRVLRIVVISTSMVPRRDPGDRPVMRMVLKPLMYRKFGEMYTDLAGMEQQLRESPAEWTVFRAPMLTDRPASGTATTTPGRSARGMRVSRADLAAAMLGCLDDPSTVRTTVGIAG